MPRTFRLPDDSFDLAISEYGACVWCEPQSWVLEAARLLRPGGRRSYSLLTNSVQVTLCVPEAGGHTGECLLRPQKGMSRVEWPGGGVEFHPSHGDWIRVLRESGFEVESLHELYAGGDATTPDYYGRRHCRLGEEMASRRPCGVAGLAVIASGRAMSAHAVRALTVAARHPARVTPHAMGAGQDSWYGIPIETETMGRMTYEIRVEGEVPDEVLHNFEGVTSRGETLDTTLQADLADAAALNGLLLALRRAGLVLLEVRREFGGPAEPRRRPTIRASCPEAYRSRGRTPSRASGATRSERSGPSPPPRRRERSRSRVC